MPGHYKETACLWRMMKAAGHEHVMLHGLKGGDHGGVERFAYPLMLDFIRRTPGHTAAEGDGP